MFTADNFNLLSRTLSPLSILKRLKSTNKCISSKASILTLLWTFSVGLIYAIGFEAKNYIQLLPQIIAIALYIGNAIILCFYPLAGFLADTKFGRFNTITRCSQLLVICILLGIVFGTIELLSVYLLSEIQNVGIVLICIASFALFLLFCLLTLSLVMFRANIIQFGMDQLQDTPADHQTLFIHWYVWISYAAAFFAELGWTTLYIHQFVKVGTSLLVFLFAFSISLLIASVCIARRKRQEWFLVDSARINPYRLVQKVTSFARRHKVPIHRSAFTYCEDDIPCGLDLGKDKYGGPFTTEQVENVKGFYGILKVLFAMGIAFYLDFSVSPLLFYFAGHLSNYTSDFLEEEVKDPIHRLFIDDNILPDLIVVLLMPVYIFLLRPFLYLYNMGILKRIGIGYALKLVMVISVFVTDTVLHSTNRHFRACMFRFDYDYDDVDIKIPHGTFYLLLPQCLSALSNMVFYTALYEFICAQSPHSMKGLLIGLSFAIQGIFEVLANFTIIPLIYFHQSFPSCGMEYYLVNIAVGVLGVVLFVCVARKYKLRERDEPCHVRRFVEDYYSKIQQEENYDY